MGAGAMTMRPAVLAVTLMTLLAACTPPGQSSQGAPSGGSAGPPAAGTPKRMTAAILADPPVLNTKINPGTVVTPGHEELERLINVGLAAVDDAGNLRGQLGESVPTLENGLWLLIPDGRMETTWKIKRDAHWHDGAPF